MKTQYILNAFEPIAPFYHINIMKQGAGYTLDYHSHDRYHFNIITNGAVEVHTSMNTMTVCSGFAFIMPPHLEHKLYSPCGYEQIGTDIVVGSQGYSIGNILDRLSDGCSIKLPVENMSSIDFINEKTLLDPSPYTALKCTNAITTVILDMADKQQLNKNPFRAKFASAAAELESDYSLDALCRRLSYSKTHLERLVKNEFGCTAIEYMERLRYVKVCNMLVSTNEPLYLIAEECGFYDSAHLSVFFKKRSGISPMKYRREFR